MKTASFLTWLFGPRAAATPPVIALQEMPASGHVFLKVDVSGLNSHEREVYFRSLKDFCKAAKADGRTSAVFHAFAVDGNQGPDVSLLTDENLATMGLRRIE